MCTCSASSWGAAGAQSRWEARAEGCAVGRCRLQGGAGGKGTRVSMPPRAAAARTRALSIRSSAYHPNTDVKRTRRTGPPRSGRCPCHMRAGWVGGDSHGDGGCTCSRGNHTHRRAELQQGLRVRAGADPSVTPATGWSYPGLCSRTSLQRALQCLRKERTQCPRGVSLGTAPLAGSALGSLGGAGPGGSQRSVF